MFAVYLTLLSLKCFEANDQGRRDTVDSELHKCNSTVCNETDFHGRPRSLNESYVRNRTTEQTMVETTSTSDVSERSHELAPSIRQVFRYDPFVDIVEPEIDSIITPETITFNQNTENGTGNNSGDDENGLDWGWYVGFIVLGVLLLLAIAILLFILIFRRASSCR